MITKEEESKFVDIATEIIFQRFFFFWFSSLIQFLSDFSLTFS